MYYVFTYVLFIELSMTILTFAGKNKLFSGITTLLINLMYDERLLEVHLSFYTVGVDFCLLFWTMSSLRRDTMSYLHLYPVVSSIYFEFCTLGLMFMSFSLELWFLEL